MGKRLGPMASPVVIAAHVDQWRPERVGQEAEIARLEVATPDDRVDPTERLAVDRMVERGIHLVRHRQKPDRRPVPILEGTVVGPRHREPASHVPSSAGSRETASSCDRSSLGRWPWPAVRSAREPPMVGASSRIGSVRRPPGGTSSVMVASISGCPLYSASATRLWPSTTQNLSPYLVTSIGGRIARSSCARFKRCQRPCQFRPR